MQRASKSEVESVLGKPVATQFVDDALRVRRNLMLASIVSLFAVFGNVRVDPSSTVLGLKLIGLTSDMINIGTFVITLYLFVHFTWYAWEAFAEWRLRLTGTKVAFKTTAILASEDGDYPDEPRQSTLHYWWVTQARAISGVPAAVEELRNLIGEVRTHIQAAPREGPYDGETLRRMGSVENVIGKLEKNMRAFEDVVNSNRVPVSLERFEAWHKLFVESQSIRWLVIDVGIPWILGLSALLTLGCAFLR